MGAKAGGGAVWWVGASAAECEQQQSGGGDDGEDTAGSDRRERVRGLRPAGGGVFRLEFLVRAPGVEELALVCAVEVEGVESPLVRPLQLIVPLGRKRRDKQIRHTVHHDHTPSGDTAEIG